MFLTEKVQLVFTTSDFEQGQFFPYFVASVLGLVLIPLTYSTLRPSTGQYQYLSSTVKAPLTPDSTRKLEGSFDQEPRLPPTKI